MSATPQEGATPPEDDGALGLSARRYASFVVRVLSQGQGGRLISGKVTHVSTRRTLRFTDLQRVVTFMRAHIGRHPVVEDADEYEPMWVDDVTAPGETG